MVRALPVCRTGRQAWSVILSVLLLTSCYTIEKRAGCDLPPLPDKALLWWDIQGSGLDVMSGIPEGMRDGLEIERNPDGDITAIYAGEESKRVLVDYVVCRKLEN